MVPRGVTVSRDRLGRDLGFVLGLRVLPCRGEVERWSVSGSIPRRWSSARAGAAEVSFTGAKFSGGKVSFPDAEFSGSEVSFISAKFSGAEVSFPDAKFSGGKVSFPDAKFSGSEVSFTGAKFSGSTVDFSNPADWAHPPEFDWKGTPPAGVKLPAAIGGQSQ